MILFGKDEERSSVVALVNLKNPNHEQTDEAGGGGQRARGRGGGCGGGGAATSLDHLKVVQNGHDVLRHEDVAGVNGHASDRDQQGVWRVVKEETVYRGSTGLGLDRLNIRIDNGSDRSEEQTS